MLNSKPNIKQKHKTNKKSTCEFRGGAIIPPSRWELGGEGRQGLYQSICIILSEHKIGGDYNYTYTCHLSYRINDVPEVTYRESNNTRKLRNHILMIYMYKVFDKAEKHSSKS